MHREYLAPQPVAIDASLHYRCVPAEDNAHELIDYEAWCAGVSDYLESKPHTRLLETLAVEIAAMSFTQWPALDALTLRFTSRRFAKARGVWALNSTGIVRISTHGARLAEYDIRWQGLKRP